MFLPLFGTAENLFGRTVVCRGEKKVTARGAPLFLGARRNVVTPAAGWAAPPQRRASHAVRFLSAANYLAGATTVFSELPQPAAACAARFCGVGQTPAAAAARFLGSARTAAQGAPVSLAPKHTFLRGKPSQSGKSHQTRPQNQP